MQHAILSQANSLIKQYINPTTKADQLRISKEKEQDKRFDFQHAFNETSRRPRSNKATRVSVSVESGFDYSLDSSSSEKSVSKTSKRQS